MRAPGFWQYNGKIARALGPFAAITAAVTARRMARPGYDCGVRVICVGNATVGGAGKTILARHIMARYRHAGIAAFALTRGHGGRLAGPALVDPAVHGARDVGDEALLLASAAPTVVAADRAAGARLAVTAGAAVIVMDDGLQNPDLAKTVSFLVIDGGAGFGNERTLPAGPLREPVVAAAARCIAGVLIGDDRYGARGALPASLPVLSARLIASSPVPLAGKRVVGFAGIGRPEKFFETLRGLGAELVDPVGFADHHTYTPADLARLDRRAAQADALLATTEKDAVKLPATFLLRCVVVGVDLAFDDATALDRFLL